MIITVDKGVEAGAIAVDTKHSFKLGSIYRPVKRVKHRKLLENKLYQ